MGQAKRRQTEIEKLKRKKKPRLRLKRFLAKISEHNVFHFRNAAARAAVDPTMIDAPLNSSDAVARAVKLGQVLPKHVHPVEIKVRSIKEMPLAAKRHKKPSPVVLVTGVPSTAEEFATRVMALAQINPNGFRQPSAKAKSWQSTSLVEKAARRAGIMEPATFERSKRGQKKLEMRLDTKAAIIAEREKIRPLKFMHAAEYVRAKAQAAAFLREAA